MDQDETHLNNLAVAHYVVGGLMALCSCMPLLHMGIGLSMVLGGDDFFQMEGNPPPEFFGWMFFGLGLLFFLMGQAFSISIIVSGRFLKRRKNYLFSFILACLSCAFFPFGTLLGVFTVIVLSKEPVKELFRKQKSLGDPA